MNIKKIVSIFLVVISVVMIGFGVYLMNSSKYIFETALDGVFDYLTEGYLNLQTEEEYEKFKLTTENKVTVSSVDFATLNGELYIDTTTSRSYINLDSTVMDEDYIAFESLIEAETVYLKIKEIMDDFYYDTIEVTEEVNDIDYRQSVKLDESEIKLLVKYLKRSILKDISDKNINKTSQTINLDGKDYKTTKVALNISEQRLGKIIENFLSSIVNDNKAIQIFQKFDKTITKDSIQEVLDTFKEESASYSSEEVFSFAFYIEGFGSLRRIELASLSDDVDSVANQEGFRFDLYNNNYNYKTYLLTMYEGATDIISYKTEYTSDSKANIVFKLEDIEINGTLEQTKTSEKLRLSLLQEGQLLGTFDYTYNVVTEGKKYTVDLVIDIQSMINITSNNTLLIGEEIPNIDVSDAQNVEEMSEEDKQELTDYFNQKLEMFGLSNSDESIEEDGYLNDENSDL